MNLSRSLVTLLAASTVISGAVFSCDPPAVGSPKAEAAERASSRPDAPATEVGPMPTLAPLVKQVRPAVVNVYTHQKLRPHPRRHRGAPDGGLDDFFERFFGDTPRGHQPQRQALGSAFLVGDGFALTNNHVVEKADEIQVKLNDGREFKAEIVGRDPSTDVALIRLQGDGSRDTPSVRLGDSDVLEVGDYVMAIGNPFGLAHTVTSGIVSAKERIIGAGPYDEFIQTDASINPGNSGGPLFNLRGEVVGINTAIVARGQGIGFAVPINLVKDLLPQLREKGRVVRGWLGVGIQEITPELARTFGLDRTRGALIAQVFPGSPAQKGGVESGDVVVEVNGRAVDSPNALSRAVAAVEPGRKVELKVLRNGKERRLKVSVGERDAQRLDGAPPSEEEEPDAESQLGLTVAPLTPEVARQLGVRRGEGLVVKEVERDSVAATAGVRPGDLLLELQRQPIDSLSAFRESAKGIRSGQSVLFRVRRGEGVLYLAARLP